MPKPTKGDPKIAVAYLRVSTDTDRQALGAQAQRDAIERWAADSGHRDHPDRFIVIARIGIVIAGSERSDVFGWFDRVRRSSRSEATRLGSVSSRASCAWGLST